MKKEAKWETERLRYDTGQHNRILIVMVLLGILAFVPVFVRLYTLMVTDYDYYANLALRNQTRTTTVTARRGNIYDRNMNVLAASVSVENVYLDPHELKQSKADISAISQELGRILDLNPSWIAEQAADTKMRYKQIAARIDETVAAQIRKYMNEQALAEFNRISALKNSVDYKWVADNAARATLDAELRSTTTCEGDIVVRLEKAVEVLCNRANHTPSEQYKALVVVQKLIVDLHTISHIAIDGIEQSKADFSFTWTAGKEGSKKHEKRGSLTWHKLWSSNFCFWHQGWSSEYYAYDIDLRHCRATHDE